MARRSFSKFEFRRRSVYDPDHDREEEQDREGQGRRDDGQLELDRQALPRALEEGGERHGSLRRIAGAADGAEQSLLAARLELAAQGRDEHVHGVRLGEGVVVPDLLEQLLAGRNQALVAPQGLEQLELPAGQLDGPLAAKDLARVGVQAQVPHDEEGASRGGRRRSNTRTRASSSSRSKGLTR